MLGLPLADELSEDGVAEAEALLPSIIDVSNVRGREGQEEDAQTAASQDAGRREVPWPSWRTMVNGGLPWRRVSA